MKIQTVTYRPDQGWSSEPLPGEDSPRTLLLVFGAPDSPENATPVRELLEAHPSSHCIGCSTSGEIHGAAVNDGSLSVAIARFEHTDLRTVTTEIASSEDSLAAGRELASRLEGPGLRAVFVLSDGLNVNGSELVQGLNSVLPREVSVSGGLAGDGERFERTWVLGPKGPRSGLVSAVGFYGERVRVDHGSRGGWSIFGPERRITRSKRNQLFELDGKPALELYKQYLGKHADGLPAAALLFPLAVRSDESDCNVVVRTILSVDEENQSMTFAGDVPEGHLAQLMQSNVDQLIEGAAQAAEEIAEEARTHGDATLAIAISCVGRRLLLGERVEEEVEAILEGLPAHTQQIGFYSYGEISPCGTGCCDLHNQTMTLTTISES